MMGTVCVVGSFMMDLIGYAPRRPLPGETLVGTDFAMFVGGKGFNQAVSARRAGAATTMIGSLGDDSFGDLFMSTLATEGIDAMGVIEQRSAGTGVGLPLVQPSGQNSIVIVPRANDLISVEDVEARAPAIEGADVLLIQLEVPIEASLAAARIGKNAGTLVILNPAPGTDASSKFKRIVDVLVPNELEVAHLTGQDPTAFDPAETARSLLDDWELDAVVLTLGEKGALLLTGNEMLSIGSHDVVSVDAVGAGDTFCGAFAAAVAGDSDLFFATRFANAAAALSVTRPGGAPSAPGFSEIDALMSTMDVRAVEVPL